MFPHLLYPFLVYRDIAFPFLVLSSIAVPCWLAFRFYRRRTPAHRPSPRREILFLIFVVQYLSRAWGSYRSADINDVVLNVLGASLGLVLVSLLRLRCSVHP